MDPILKDKVTGVAINNPALNNLPYPLNQQILSGDFNVDTADNNVTVSVAPANYESTVYLPDLSGVWAIEERAGRLMYQMLNKYVESGANLAAMYPGQDMVYKSSDYSGKTATDRFVTWYDDGVAVININGVLMRDEPPSKLFGGSCITYKQITDVLIDLSMTEAAKSIVLKVSSFGGNAMGVYPCADSIAEVNKIKPVTAFVDDNCCSAAYLLASQCSKIVSSKEAYIGSIGAVTVLVDDSEAAEKLGIKRHVIASSPKKGLGMDGKVSKELKELVQERVDRTHESFRNRVMQGRKMNEKETDAVSTGDIFFPEQAMELKLIDKIANFHDLYDISTESDKPTSNRRSKNQSGGSNEMAEQDMQALQDELKASNEAQAKAEKELAEAKAELEASRATTNAIAQTAAANVITSADTVVEHTITTESVDDDKTDEVPEEVRAELEASRKKQESLQAQLDAVNAQREQEENTFRLKLVSNWVDKKVAESHMLPADASAMKLFLGTLIGNREEVSLEVTSKDGTTETISGQHYEVAAKVLSKALSSKMNFSEMSHSKPNLSVDEKAEIEGDWFSAEMERDGVDLEHEQVLGMDVKTNSAFVGANRTGVSGSFHEQLGDASAELP